MVTGEMDIIEICHRCFSCADAHKYDCFFVRRRAQTTKQKKKQKNYSFLCAIWIEKVGLHTNFLIFRRFGFFFVYDKAKPSFDTLPFFQSQYDSRVKSILYIQEVAPNGMAGRVRHPRFLSSDKDG